MQLLLGFLSQSAGSLCQLIDFGQSKLTDFTENVENNGNTHNFFSFHTILDELLKLPPMTSSKCTCFSFATPHV